jgi:Icc-related predicted phosphoesterase
MKILCISDQIDPLIYSASIKERYGDIDLILSAGDLPMEYLGFIVTCLNKPMLFVFGNHNLKELPFYKPSYDDTFHHRSRMDEMAALSSGAIHIGTKVIREEGLIVAGLGGSIMYNKGKNQYTDFQMTLEILSLIPALIINRIFKGRFLDILLTHAPPRGIHDKEDPCHRGFKSFLWFMRLFKPKYLVHGHIHLYDLCDIRKTRYGQTMVVNAYSHFLIDTGDAP